MFQSPKTPNLDKKDHVWRRLAKGQWKCCTCGAMTPGMPPEYPTPEDWLPRRYEPLESMDRLALPFRR